MSAAVEQFQQQSIMQQAEMLSKSNLVPKAFRGKPADILVATLWGAEVGLGPIASMNFIDIIDGTPTMNAEGASALIRRAGHSLIVNGDAERCVVKGKRRDSGDEQSVTWTMEDAKRAKLADKDNWRKYPRAMLRSRAVSEIARSLFSDVFMGITYSPEEVESFSPPPVARPRSVQEAIEVGGPHPEAQMGVLEQGAIVPPPNVDTTTGEILDAEVVDEPQTLLQAGLRATEQRQRGFKPPAVRSQSAQNTDAIMQQFADADAVKATAALKERVDAIDAFEKDSLADAWKAAQLPSLTRLVREGGALTAEQLEQATAIVAEREPKDAA